MNRFFNEVQKVEGIQEKIVSVAPATSKKDDIHPDRPLCVKTEPVEEAMGDILDISRGEVSRGTDP